MRDNASYYSSSLSSSDVEMDDDDDDWEAVPPVLETKAITREPLIANDRLEIPDSDNEPEAIMDNETEPVVEETPESAMEEPEPVMNAPHPVINPSANAADNDPDPFEALKPKVIELFQFLWPGTPADRLFIKDMGQRKDSHIISIRFSDMVEIIDDSDDEGPNYREIENRTSDTDNSLPRLFGAYVLRVQSPDRYPPPSWTAAMLGFLNSKLSIPVPTVIWHDNSSCNPMGMPCILRKHIYGISLDRILRVCTHTQRGMIAMDLAHLYRELMYITNDSHGRPIEDDLAFAAPGASLRTKGYLSFERPDRYRTPIQPEDAHATACLRCTHYGYNHGGRFSKEWRTTIGKIPLMDDAFRPGQSAPYYLTHDHIWPQNIIITCSTIDSARIAGIIDWDDVYFAPPVVAFSPPGWLWGLAGFFPTEEGLVRDVLTKLAPLPPPNNDLKIVKYLFNATLGHEYMRHAYSIHSETARLLWSLVYGPNEDPADDLVNDFDYEEMHRTWVHYRLMQELAAGDSSFTPEFYECERWVQMYIPAEPDGSGE